MATSSRQAPEGWYHAEGDPPGTNRFWNGEEWVGDPVVQDASADRPAAGEPSEESTAEAGDLVADSVEPDPLAVEDEILPDWTVAARSVPIPPAIRADVAVDSATALDPDGPGAEAEPPPAMSFGPPSAGGDRKRRGSTIAVAALALLVVALGSGWAIAWLADSSSDTRTTAASDDSSETEGAAPAGELVSAADDLDPAGPTADRDDGSDPAGDADVTTDPAGDDADGTAEDSGAFVVPETPDNPSGAAQYTVMADNKAYMRGWYPNAELAQGAVDDAAVIMGGIENVVDETRIDPRAEIQPESYAVYFENYVLFESDSAEVAPDFYEFLGYPLFFMMNNADATVTVVAYTDARGPSDYNLELATRRAEAVRDFWLANGGNADQIILDPKGEEGADADASDEEAQLDRRVELVVSGFLPG